MQTASPQARPGAWRLLAPALAAVLATPLAWAAQAEAYSASKAYATPNTEVTYSETDPATGVTRTATFRNAWWTQGDKPSFVPNHGPWKMVGQASVSGGQSGSTAVLETTPAWSADGAYAGGSVVKRGSSCYKARYWTQGTDPAVRPAQAWQTPWDVLTSCDAASAVVVTGTGTTDNKVITETKVTTDNKVTTDEKVTTTTGTTDKTGPSGDNGSGGSGTQPAWSASQAYVAGALVQKGGVCYEAKYWTQGNDPAAKTEFDWQSPWEKNESCKPKAKTVAKKTDDKKAEGKKDEKVTTPVVVDTSPSALPAEGYAFLRQVTDAQWDWLFPMRSGRYNLSGATRNMPPIAMPDGSTDVYTLANFRRAVMAYNGLAQSKGYKQFLNEGTLKQQAQEFLMFWAKASRETSGSWDDAPAPWAEDTTDSQGRPAKAWKGGLYWVEEVGYSSNADGTSPTRGYADPHDTWPPEPGRDYYGRGVIQLTHPYNYGPFSAWLYDNKLFRNIVTERNTLLKRPDYVATYSQLAMISGIWFWMTPQGIKPSSHDVLYGDVTQISRSNVELGLPRLRDGYTVKGALNAPVARGDTTDEMVMAYRMGTIINIVNGGLECNGAAGYHQGPGQRVSYYNVYAAYFNQQIPGLNATRLPSAENLWQSRISDASNEVTQTATCYNQKSYYGW